MKTYLKNPLLLPALIAGLGFMLAGRVMAQTLSTLHVFTVTDGLNSEAGLIISSNTLYGTTDQGGSSGDGTIFGINTDGSGFTNLHTFMGNDGKGPKNLILSGNVLYGTTSGGGSGGDGTAFAINTDGMGFTNLHNFNPSGSGSGVNGDGENPSAGLILSSNTLYGTTSGGGSMGYGIVFAVSINGTGFTNLHNFNPNSDGAAPRGGLIISSNTLYGTTYQGGPGANPGGTVFAINTNGSGFTVLHTCTSSSGYTPEAGLILSGNALYGTTQEGGSGTSAYGTVFAINTNGMGFTNLHTFMGNDGSFPEAGLLLSSNTLYGTTEGGGSGGTVFAINTDGMGFTNLHNFTGGSDGGSPICGLVLSSNTLYGTTASGGSSFFEAGTIFALNLTKVPVSPHAATATPVLTNDFVVGANITDGGYGYTNIPNVRIIGGGGSGAQSLAVVSNGVVTSIEVLDAGFGYTSAPVVVIDPPFIPIPVLAIAPMSYLTFSNLTTGSNYQLQELMANFWSNPPLSFTASNSVYSQMLAGILNGGDYRLALSPVPAQAFATPQMDNGFVVGATVTSGGSGYVASPTVSIVGGGGSNATAVAQISGGVVTNIMITDAGIGYTSTPTIGIDPPPVTAVLPIVQPVMRVDSSNLAPYDNYQIQFTPSLSAAWGNWNGGLFTPTDVTNSQFLFITNGIGFFRLQYVP